MSDFKLSGELKQSVVDGLMEGYREYLEVRREKSREMLVSGAYAWVKGNHIDDQVARYCQQYGVKSKLAKAGLTWQYLQFQHKDEKMLFIIRNARYFNKEQVDRGRDAKGRLKKDKISYLENLIKINSHVNFAEVKTVEPGDSVQLELFEESVFTKENLLEVEKIKTEYDLFYIITYEIDENQLISRISLFMPSPYDNKAYLIDDLTPYIKAHTIHIDEELKEVLSNEIEITKDYNAYSFDISISDKAKEKDND